MRSLDKTQLLAIDSDTTDDCASLVTEFSLCHSGSAIRGYRWIPIFGFLFPVGRMYAWRRLRK